MALTLTHPFVSTIPDGSDATVVRPSNWNANHTVAGVLDVANGGTGVTTSTGSGANVLSTSPTLATPNLGTPSTLVGTNITGTAAGLTAGNVTTNANLTGAVTSVGNATSLGSFSSASLLAALTDKTGSGIAVFATSPTLTTPVLGAATFTSLTAGNVVIDSSNITITNTGAYSWSGRGTITSPSAGIINLGAVSAAAPVSYTLRNQGSRSGTDTNVAGGTLTIASGFGTGNSTPSKIIFQSPVAVASGTGAQTMTTGLTLNVGTAVLTNYTVATLPSAATAGAGATAFVTDSSTTLILGLGLTVAGGGANKVPVYSDGTNWIVG